MAHICATRRQVFSPVTRVPASWAVIRVVVILGCADRLQLGLTRSGTEVLTGPGRPGDWLGAQGAVTAV
jgi:hypothetical protein